MLFVTEVYAFKYGNFITACFNGESQTERRFPLQPLHGGAQAGFLPVPGFASPRVAGCCCEPCGTQ